MRNCPYSHVENVCGAMGDQGIGQRGSRATSWRLHQPVKKFGLDPGCVGGALSPTPVLCNSFIHQTQACLEILKPLGLKEGDDVGGSFPHRIQDVLTAELEEDSQLLE